MRMRLLPLAVCALLMSGPVSSARAAPGGPTVAVLELQNAAALTPQEAAYVTDLVRWAAVPGAASSGLSRSTAGRTTPISTRHAAFSGR